MPPSPTRHRVAVVLALVGVAVSVLTFHVTRQLASVDGYTSFCNLGGVVNCDAVLTSRWGSFLGLPVPLWAIAVFTLGLVLALPGALGATTVGLADLMLIALASGSVGFALVLAVISALVLRTACLLCISLYVVILAWFVTVAPLARRFHGTDRSPWLERRTAAYAASAAGLLLAIAAGTVEAMRGPGTATTVAEVQRTDPKFYELYTKLPVLDAADVLGPAPYVKGNPDAPITIVEFSDFECPACGHAFSDLRDLVRGRSDVKLVFRNFPLDSACNPHMQQQLHPDACRAAAAAECAGKLGRFWEYHDELFEHQKLLDRDSLFRYAREVGLDIPAFRACLDDPATMDRIAADVEAGTRLGVESTPTIFINGRRVQGALDRPYYEFALVIEKDRLARAGDAAQRGS
jgi:protein-disulfide isomerase